jgi:hypothetical protein
MARTRAEKGRCEEASRRQLLIKVAPICERAAAAPRFFSRYGTEKEA